MTAPRTVLVAIALLVLAGCGQRADGDGATAGGDAPSPTAAASQAGAGQRYPDIVEVEITAAGEQTFDLAVTVSSPYDTPERYADGWRVLTPDGSELATHTLLHDHAGEQPFTRTQTGVEIPPDVERVTVEGRDQQYGFGGDTVTVDVPHDA
jgi:hypothetical protein